MKIGKWARLALFAAPLAMAGCGNFWQDPYTGNGGAFSLSNSGDISITAGATSNNTSTITVTPSSSFTGTVDLTCTVAAPTGATSPATCSLSPTSVSISSSTAGTSTLTATTTTTTTAGAYTITVTGVSGSTTETTTVCAVVGSTSSTCSGSAAGTSGNFYVLNQKTQEVAAFNISSGALHTIGALTLPGSQAPIAIAVEPNGTFLYVSTLTGIYLYTIDSTSGALTLGNGGNPISSDPATSMQVDATSSWLVDAVANELFAIAINSSTGQLATSGETEQTFTGGLPGSATQLAISPTDSSSCTNCYVFVGMGSSGTDVIPFNPGNTNPFGTAHSIPVKNSGGGANAVAVDPGNLLLYVGETDAASGSQSGVVRVFTVASGFPELSGSPYTTGGTGPSSIVATSDGSYLYVANRSVSGSSDGNISRYSVSTGGLSFIATSAAGPTGLLSLAQDSTGGFLFATDSAGNPDLQVFTIGSGSLTSVLTVATGSDPVGAIAIAAAP